MSKSDLLEKIAKLINEEHDEHARLIAEVQSRTTDKKLLDTLILVYKTRTECWEKFYKIVKES
jgi:hypothetical protein